MAQIINTNYASLDAQRQLSRSQESLNTSLQRLSSGLRINSAKDDAAGLAISQRFSAQINGMDQAQRNANDGVSLSQTAEGALGQMGDLLQRIRQLAVQSANGTNSASDRQSINSEVGQLVSELDRFAQTTQFNGMNLLDGTFTSVAYQVGANANQTITATSQNFRTTSYGTAQELSNNVATVASGGAATANALYSNSTLTVNGGYGSGTVSIATTDSAKSIAANINQKSGDTGVKATAQTQFDLAFSGGGAAYSLNVLGTNTTAVNVSFSTTANTAAGLASAITAFNNVSGQTGITAQLNGAGTAITLTAADGSNVNLAQTAAASGTLTVSATTGYTNAAGLGGTATGVGSGLGSVTVAGSIDLESDRSYSTTLSAASSGLFTAGVAGTTASTLKAVSTLDVTTVANSNLAINIVDQALTIVNNQRAAFGALQNRFSATISNLQTSSQNMSSARSRIQDADFASETASLTRAQVLQQAGTAMLAQANSLPNQVLTLLR